MSLSTSPQPSSLKLLVMCGETSTGNPRQLGAADWRGDHTVISAEQAHTSYPSLRVCVFMCLVERGEEHTLPGNKPAAKWWKPDISFVFRPQVIAEKMSS